MRCPSILHVSGALALVVTGLIVAGALKPATQVQLNRHFPMFDSEQTPERYRSHTVFNAIATIRDLKSESHS
jgi:hypothetical protein